MTSQQTKLARIYLKTLGRYLTDDREVVLQQAYELGRAAVSSGAGVLDMAKAHQAALESVLKPAPLSKDHGLILKAAEIFFLETLSPFEVTHRGFRETNARLQQLNATLARRNIELAETNRELGREIGGRKRTEKALRESENHFHELFDEARRMGEDLRNLSNQILHVQEEERKRISRELHDEVGQALTAISVILATLKNCETGGSGAGGQKLADTQDLLRETMETVHRFARELRPAMLDELGLLPALRSYLKGFASRTGIRVHFRGNPIAEKLRSDQKTALFRIAQESLTNAGKHACASQVELVIRKIYDGVCMEVADNGCSFQVDLKKTEVSKTRLGLLGMQERVRLIDGEFTIKSRPDKGTTIRVVIPFESTGAVLLSQRMRNHNNNKRLFGRVRPQQIEIRKR